MNSRGGSRASLGKSTLKYSPPHPKQRLNEHDPDDSHHILRMLDFFYFKEHLFIARPPFTVTIPHGAPPRLTAPCSGVVEAALRVP